VFLERIIDNVRKIVRTAEYDELTGLANRHQIAKLLKIHDIGGPTGPTNYGVAIIDIDNFKKVNDQFGHLAGDRVLYDIAVILRSVETSGTYAFRWGGEEFMILTLEDEATERLRDVCERVRKLVAANTTIYELHRIGVTVSVGYTKADAVSEDFSSVVERADTCLYYAKGHGKNQVITKEDMK
jgi:diguanylate cyclase (GGDEF)-like protein